MTSTAAQECVSNTSTQADFLSMCLQDPEGKPKKANIRDNRDGTYTVSYVPDMTGRYTITIKYGGDEIPYSPYRIHALPTGDASKCLVTGQTPPITALLTNHILSPELSCSITDAPIVLPQCPSEDTDWVSD